MILSKKLSEAFNAQVNAEMWSSNLYLSMSVHFQKLGLNGFAHWMKKQAEEDKDHASRDFLFGFVREQVEEESTAKEIVEQLKNYGECHVGILDHRLGKR